MTVDILSLLKRIFRRKPKVHSFQVGGTITMVFDPTVTPRTTTKAVEVLSYNEAKTVTRG